MLCHYSSVARLQVTVLGGSISCLVTEDFEVRSGQLRFITRPKSRTMRAKRKKTFESNQNEGAQMSNELESHRATVMNLESFCVDGFGYDETETEPPSSTTPQ